MKGKSEKKYGKPKVSNESAALPFVASGLRVLLSSCREIPKRAQRTGTFRKHFIYAFFGRALSIWDPTSSYSSDETPYTYNIYEPLYQYHYLKRPYELIPRAAERIVQPVYFDKNENKLGKDADPEEVALSVYEILLKKGIMYAPHPAFARDAEGRYVNIILRPRSSTDCAIRSICRKKELGSSRRKDYVYAIKRMANPRIISPIFGTMANHLPGLNEYAVLVRAEDERLRRGLSPTDRDLPFLDFRKIPLKGVSAPDKYTLRLEVKGKYPQFSNWLAMTFFSSHPLGSRSLLRAEGYGKEQSLSELLAGRNRSLHAGRID